MVLLLGQKNELSDDISIIEEAKGTGKGRVYFKKVYYGTLLWSM